MSVWESMWPYKAGDQAMSDDIFYVCVRSTDTPELIKKIPITHGPVRKRGKGKVNRDWEK